MSDQKPREIAVRVLQRHASAEDFVENLLERELGRNALSAPDRGLVQELVYGIVRWQKTLNWLIDQKTGGRPQKPTLRILLQLGLYQLFWLDRIPDHAAVHETVELAKRLGFAPQAGFLNAILRGFIREQAQTQTALEQLKLEEPHLGYSHPDWLFERWQTRWGWDKTIELLQWNNSPPPTFARVNTIKISGSALMDNWQKEGVDFVPHSFPWTGPDLVFELQGHPPLASLPSFQNGSFYIQDPSTLLAVSLLAPCPGESVLDLCSAPGGKTTFIAQLMQNRGSILAQDTSQERLKLVSENYRRLGITCVATALASPQLEAQPARQFDRILIDAPCSNTGVLRRRVELRWRIREEEIDRLSDTQLEILHLAAPRLKPGGVLVYSTCSLEPEENSAVVHAFLETHPDYLLEMDQQLIPFNQGVDGAYVARLRRR